MYLPDCFPDTMENKILYNDILKKLEDDPILLDYLNGIFTDHNSLLHSECYTKDDVDSVEDQATVEAKIEIQCEIENRSDSFISDFSDNIRIELPHLNDEEIQKIEDVLDLLMHDIEEAIRDS